MWPLRDGDVLTIRQDPGWNDLAASVTVKGEVEHAGSFGIKPNERLSSVLARAGGFSPEAYPYGAVLMRREVRELEMRSRAELVERMKMEMANLRVITGERHGSEERKDDGDRTGADGIDTATGKPTDWARGHSHRAGFERVAEYRVGCAGARWRCIADSEEGGLRGGDRASIQSDGRGIPQGGQREVVFESGGWIDATRG